MSALYVVEIWPFKPCSKITHAQRYGKVLPSKFCFYLFAQICYSKSTSPWILCHKERKSSVCYLPPNFNPFPVILTTQVKRILRKGSALHQEVYICASHQNFALANTIIYGSWVSGAKWLHTTWGSLLFCTKCM